MDSLLKSSYEDLIAVPDIGPRMAAKITDYIRDIENKTSLEKLLNCINIINPDLKSSNEDLLFLDNLLSKNLNDPKLIAVGEIGLDFFLKNLDRNKMEKIYLHQLKLAKKPKITKEIRS